MSTTLLIRSEQCRLNVGLPIFSFTTSNSWSKNRCMIRIPLQTDTPDIWTFVPVFWRMELQSMKSFGTLELLFLAHVRTGNAMDGLFTSLDVIYLHSTKSIYQDLRLRSEFTMTSYLGDLFVCSFFTFILLSSISVYDRIEEISCLCIKLQLHLSLY